VEEDISLLPREQKLLSVPEIQSRSSWKEFHVLGLLQATEYIAKEQDMIFMHRSGMLFYAFNTIQVY
jgi:hypothetical protein